MPIDPITGQEVPLPPGQAPTVRTFDWRTQVMLRENLHAPHVEYRFSNGRTFRRRDGQSGIYDNS